MLTTSVGSFSYINPSPEDGPLVSRTTYFKTVSSKIVNMSKLLLCLVASTLAGPLPEDQALAETK